MAHFTLDDLTRFTQQEKKMVEEVLQGLGREAGPSEAVLDRILDYSRAYSVRRSEEIGFIRMVLN
ncbi:MAG: hypothetical protein ACK5XV_00495 [Flavobacteriales bacterium]|jgi:hypothetical protein